MTVDAGNRYINEVIRLRAMLNRLHSSQTFDFPQKFQRRVKIHLPDESETAHPNSQTNMLQHFAHSFFEEVLASPSVSQNTQIHSVDYGLWKKGLDRFEALIQDCVDIEAGYFPQSDPMNKGPQPRNTGVYSTEDIEIEVPDEELDGNDVKIGGAAPAPVQGN